MTGVVGVIPGATMNERRLYFVEHLDHVRRLLVNEPRGHAAMSGAILQPPTRPDADFGVLYIEVSGCLPICGHGAMGAATVLVETGLGQYMLDPTDPYPAGFRVLRMCGRAVRDHTLQRSVTWQGASASMFPRHLRRPVNAILGTADRWRLAGCDISVVGGRRG